MNIQILNLIVTYLIFLQCMHIVISDDSICSGCKFDNDNNICKKKNSEECTDSPCECDEYYCKPNKENSKCFDCSNVLKFSLSKYYSIENDVCIGKSGSDCKKIIIENNQCVDICPNYEFGDFCFKSCSNSEYSSFGFAGEDEPTKKCKCNKFLINETINEKTYTRCVDSCPSGYSDFNTQECVKKCEGSTNRITEDNKCIDICPEYLFEKTETINNEKITKLYCVSKCPDEARFYYTNLQNQEKKCLKECNRGHFMNA